MSIDTREQTVRTLTQALIDSDLAALLALATEDATWTLAGTTPWSGTYPIGDLFKLSGQMFVDTEGPFTGGVTSVIVSAEAAAVEAWGHVRFIDGREYRNEVVLIVQFRGDKVSAVKEYGDTQLLVQLFGGRKSS